MLVVRRVVLVFALISFAGAARGDTWLGGAVTDWFSAVAWSDLLGPPTASENAIFARTVFGVTPVNSSVSLPGNATIVNLTVDIPSSTPYVFTGSNGAVLTATSQMDFLNTDRRASNVTSVSSMRLNTPALFVRHNAVLSLNNATVTTNSIRTTEDGRIEVSSGSSVQTLSYGFDQPSGELRVNSGGELRVAGDTKLVRGLTRVNSGGQLNAASGVDLEYNGAARLEFADSHTVDNFVHLKATGGGDITAGEYIDVGNGAIGSLTVTGAGSTLTAQSNVSDWGASSTGNATVTVSNSGVATVSDLRAGTGDATFVGNVTSGGTLRTMASFLMGGGPLNRTVSLTVDGGTLETAALAKFDNKASLSLINGTVNFNGGATFNAGSLPIWGGGNMNLGANSTLLVDGTDFVKSTTAGFIFSDNTTTRIRNGGNFQTPSYFDLGNATLDMNSSFLTAGTTGGTVSDWGSGASTTATLTNNARATYNSGLRMCVSSGTTNATISGGAQLVANEFLQTGGVAGANVTLNVDGGQVKSDGSLLLERGTTTTISNVGRVEGQNVVLGSSGGTTTTTVTGSSSLLKARGTLFAGRAGTSALNISAGGKAESVGSTIIGELAGASASVTVTGAGSRLDVGSSLTVGAGGTGQLNIDAGGFVPVFGGVTVGSSGTLFLTGGGSLETSVGQSVVNNGALIAASASQIRADVVNAGSLNLSGASVTRGVTLQANSDMTFDGATVGSLTQQAGADLNFELRGASDFNDLSVTGSASLGGDFVVSLGEGFAPTAGMSFPIFTAGSISGSPNFDFSAAPLPSGLGWGIAIGPTSLGLAVISTSIPGDFNFDGFVDGADLLIWQRGGSPSANSPADLALWKANFGGSMTATAATLSVPEPQTWALGALACLALRRSRGNRPTGLPTTC
ncbi:hypothetical protein I41_24520 [Lacipirellula limnantheis]|uniref:Autotransporter-associated beta strand repeat protein n=2 Tax=Lacipirellula limnantheis TaxID=2528024 RepID=A0A517TY09_9BACT|nr:hypothetical protein I41_24520 [Lacipirellula limnantheis]